MIPVGHAGGRQRGQQYYSLVALAYPRRRSGVILSRRALDHRAAAFAGQQVWPSRDSQPSQGWQDIVLFRGEQCNGRLRFRRTGRYAKSADRGNNRSCVVKADDGV